MGASNSIAAIRSDNQLCVVARFKINSKSDARDDGFKR